MKKIIYALFGLLTAVSCDLGYRNDGIEPSPATSDYLMTVVNSSKESTVWIIPEYREAAPGELPDELTASEEAAIIKLEPASTQEVYVYHNGIIHPTETYKTDASVKIYVIEASVYSTKTLNEIRTGELWLRQFSLTVDDLIATERKVVYSE